MTQNQERYVGRFIAKRNFKDADLKSSYQEGLTYHCREGQVYDLLASKIPGWIEEGKIELIEGAPAPVVKAGAGPSNVAGQGTVS